MILGGHLIWPPRIMYREDEAQRRNDLLMDSVASYWAETRAQFSVLSLQTHYSFIQQIFLKHPFCARHQGYKLESYKVPPGTHELQGAHSLKRQMSKQLQCSAVRAVIEGGTGPWSSEKRWRLPRVRQISEKPWLKKNWKGRKDEAWVFQTEWFACVKALRHETAGSFTGNASSTVWFCRPEEPDQGEIINWEQKNSVFTKVGCSHLFSLPNLSFKLFKYPYVPGNPSNKK